MSAPDPNLDPDARVPPTPRSGAAAWWVAGIVAVVAIVAVAYMTRSPAAPDTSQQLTAAADQGRAQGYVEGAQTTAQTQAMQAPGIAAQQSLADQAAQARTDAQVAAQRADRAAASADRAGRDASATAPQSSSDSSSSPGQ